MIHHSLPKSLTNYYQESGRAGRDGATSECVLYFSYKDKSKIASMIIRSAEERNRSSGYQARGNHNSAMQQGLENLNRCVSYCLNEVECRRKLVLEYFGETFPREQCKKTCDNCLRAGTIVEEDMSIHGKIIVYLIREIVESGLNSLTLIRLAKLYAGSKDKDSIKYEACILNARNKFAEKENLPRGGVKETVATLSRDVAERVIQHMLVYDYLQEQSVSTYGNYSAEYIMEGPRSGELLNSTVAQRKLMISIKRSGSVAAAAYMDDAPVLPKVKYVKKSKSSTEDVSGTVAKAKKKLTSKSKVAQQAYEEDWIESRPQTASRSKPAKGSAVAGDGLYRVGNELGMLQTTPQLNRFRSFQSPILKGSEATGSTFVTQSTSYTDEIDLTGSSMVYSADGEEMNARAGTLLEAAQRDTRIAQQHDYEIASESDDNLMEITSAKKGVSARKKIVKKKPKRPVVDSDSDSSAVVVVESERIPTLRSLLSFKQKQLFTDWLEAYRKRWTKYWLILKNEIVADIVDKVPLTIEELAQIPDFGLNRAKGHGDHILATIYAFLESQDLLHLFPAAKEPTIPACPTW